MKTHYRLALATLLFAFSISAFTQDMQFSSGLDWQVGLSQDGPFDLTVHDISYCVDDAVIDSACGTFYASPMLPEHFEGCNNMKPIWGVASPANCRFPGATFWFNKKFTLPDFSCSPIIEAVAKVQADNAFTFYLNGEEIGSSIVSQWQILFEYAVADHLIEGENDITIRVENLAGGTCFNYAFLAFCMDVFTTPNCPNLSGISLNSVYVSSEPGAEGCLRDLETDAIPCAAAYVWTLTYPDSLNLPPLTTTTNTHVLAVENILNGNAYPVDVHVRAICPSDQSSSAEDNFLVSWDEADCMSVSTDTPVQEDIALHLFPNPTSADLFLEFDMPTQAKKIAVVDAAGRIVYTKELQAGTLVSSINTTDWAKGLYFLSCRINGQLICRRFIVL